MQAPKHYRILVVDDEDAIRALLAEYLSLLGKFEVIQAKNAFDAFSILEQTCDVDGVIVDINMPGMDGIEFIGRIKDRDPKIVGIVITGNPSFARILEAMRAGASDFLSKPFKSENLQVAMERLVKERDILVENSALNQELKGKKELEAINERLQRKIREQTILYTISETLGKVRSTRDLYRKTVSLASSLTETTNACFWAINHEKQKIILMANEGTVDPAWVAMDLHIENMPVARVARDGLPALHTTTFGPSGKKGFLTRFSGMAIVPFKIREEVFGVLAVFSERGGKTLGEEALFLLLLLAERASLTVENLLLYESVAFNLHATLRALVRSLEAKDSYTKEHSERVTRLSLAIAKQMGCPEEEIDSLNFAGHLHDIGKIGIMDQILLKPGKLTQEEYEIIKAHPVIGEEIIGHLGVLPLEKGCVRHHHERWDGKGYPDELAGSSIPKLARILAISDTYDAITTNRPYRLSRSREDAVTEIKKNGGTQFDPEIVEVFLDTIYAE